MFLFVCPFVFWGVVPPSAPYLQKVRSTAVPLMLDVFQKRGFAARNQPKGEFRGYPLFWGEVLLFFLMFIESNTFRAFFERKRTAFAGSSF